MENRNFYNQILTEHNLHPEHKHDLADANLVLEGVNPSCGDDITLKLKVDGDVITDGAFVGDGCAISQASTDIMLGMIIGKKGAMLKKIASESRTEIESFLESRVNLQCWVKIREDWRNSEFSIRDLGFN